MNLRFQAQGEKKTREAFVIELGLRFSKVLMDF